MLGVANCTWLVKFWSSMGTLLTVSEFITSSRCLQAHPGMPHRRNPSAQHCAQASRQTTPAGLVKGRALCREDIFQSFLLPDAILNHIALKHRQSWWDINYLKNKYYRVLLWMLHDAAYFLSSHFPNQFCYIPIPVQSQPPSLPTFSPVLH